MLSPKETDWNGNDLANVYRFIIIQITPIIRYINCRCKILRNIKKKNRRTNSKNHYNHKILWMVFYNFFSQYNAFFQCRSILKNKKVVEFNDRKSFDDRRYWLFSSLDQECNACEIFLDTFFRQKTFWETRNGANHGKCRTFGKLNSNLFCHIFNSSFFLLVWKRI